MKSSSKAFTLMELMVSIALIGLIVVYLYSITNSLKISNDSLGIHEKKSAFVAQLEELLFRDILEIRSEKIVLKEGFSKDASIISFQTNNTLYDINYPYVSYFLSRDKTLLRMESLYDLNLSDKDFRDSAKVLEIASNVDKFRVFSDKLYKKFLFFIEIESQTPIYFEVERVADYSKTLTVQQPAQGQPQGEDAPPPPPSGAQGDMPPQIPSESTPPQIPESTPPQIPQDTPPLLPGATIPQQQPEAPTADTPPPPPPAPPSGGATPVMPN